MTPPEYLTYRSAAALLGVSPSQVQQWVRYGRLHHHPERRAGVLDRAEVEALKAQREGVKA